MTDPNIPQTPPNEPYYQQNRPEQPRRWGSTLLIIGIAWLVFELVRQSFFSGFAFGAVEEEITEPPRTFAGATALTVRTTVDDIELYGTDEAAVLVEIKRRGFGWDSSAAREAMRRVEVTTTRDGDRVTVIAERAPKGFSFGRGPHITLRIGVPAGVDLQINTASGNINVDEVAGRGSIETVSGDIDAVGTEGTLAFNTTSGDIVLQEHAGNPSVRTVSGDIEVSGEGVVDLNVESISGDVDLESISGVLRAKTTSGYINLEDGRDLALNVESTSGDIDLNGGLAPRREQRVTSVSGDVALQLSEPQSLRLEATTLSGDLESDLELQQLVQERRRLAGTLGPGDTILLINTTSGDVQVGAD